MKKIGFLLLAIIILFSCSSDENTAVTTENGFTFDGTFYETNTLYIIDQNTSDVISTDIAFRFINKTKEQIIGAPNLSDINTLTFNFNAIKAEATTYTNIQDYGCSLHGTRVAGETFEGDMILSDNETSLEASTISVTINSITYDTVDLSFTFTRTDGKIIKGKFIGNYLGIAQLPATGPMTPVQ